MQKDCISSKIVDICIQFTMQKETNHFEFTDQNMIMIVLIVVKYNRVNNACTTLFLVLFFMMPPSSLLASVGRFEHFKPDMFYKIFNYFGLRTAFEIFGKKNT